MEFYENFAKHSRIGFHQNPQRSYGIMQKIVEVREHLIEKHRKGMHALPIPTPAPVGFDSVDNFSSVATSGLVALCSISCSAVTRRSMQTKMRTS